jgi:DNA-binding transcriptional ArsR family regulator
VPARRSVDLRDPRALRALAHPVRLNLVSLLRRGGPLTATQAGELLHESPASCSFHLRQLAKYGLVEEAGGGRGRERPWRATALFTTFPSVTSTPELAAAAEEFGRFVAERQFGHLVRWLEERAHEPVEWQEAAVFGDTMLYLTPEELQRLGRDLEALAERYVERTADPRLRPEGARLVSFLRLAFPLLAVRE